jgi:hypothetical protein
MKVTPLLPHVRDPLIPPPLRAQGTLNDAGARHAPVPRAATRGQCDLVPRYPQGSPMASARARPLPLCPVAQPDAPPEPVVQCDHLRLPAAVSARVAPSRDLPSEDLDADFPVPPVAPCGPLTAPLLAPLD